MTIKYSPGEAELKPFLQSLPNTFFRNWLLTWNVSICCWLKLWVEYQVAQVSQVSTVDGNGGVVSSSVWKLPVIPLPL